VYSTLIFPLLYKLAAQKVQMDWNSSMRSSKLALHRLMFLWCYGVFLCSIPFRKRVILVIRDIIYVINILYSWYLVIYEYFWSVCVEQMILGIHTMSTWFWHKKRTWQSCPIIAVGWWHLSGGCEAPGLGYLVDYWPCGRLCYRIFTWSKSSFIGGMITLCQSHLDV
jgi:hypothetical protein